MEQAVDLRFDLRNALQPLMEHPRIFAVLREVEPIAEALGDPRRLAWLGAYFAQYFYTQGQPERAIESSQRVMALAASLDDVPLRATSTAFLGIASHAAGDYRGAVDALRENLASLEDETVRQSSGLGFPALTSRAWLTWCLGELGDFPEGRSHGETGLTSAARVQAPGPLILALYTLGYVHLRQGRLADAISVLERGLELHRTSDVRIWFAPNASFLGCALALAGRPAEALRLCEQAVEQASGIRHVFHSWWLANLAEAYLAGRCPGEALAWAERALDLSREHGERGVEAWVRRLLGEIAQSGDRLDETAAEGHYRAALALAGERGMRPLVAHGHLGLGALYGKTGKPVEARAELIAAADLYRDMDMSFWLARTEAALGA